MATNGTVIAAKPRFEEEYKSQTQARRYAPESRVPEPQEAREVTDDFVLAPLVDKIAFGIAKGLVVAVKELEQHIASETRKVSDTVERQMDALQVNLQELFRFVSEQRTANAAVEERLQQLAAADAGLLESNARQDAELTAIRTDVSASVAAMKEGDARQAADLATFQNESKAFWKSISDRLDNLSSDVGVQQEDIGAVKTTLGSVNSRIDAIMERLDRQAEAVRLMHTNYSQRETELEQLVSGLARLRSFPTPLPTNGL
jgi:chromosome segregation ATPase